MDNIKDTILNKIIDAHREWHLILLDNVEYNKTTFPIGEEVYTPEKGEAVKHIMEFGRVLTEEEIKQDLIRHNTMEIAWHYYMSLQMLLEEINKLGEDDKEIYGKVELARLKQLFEIELPNKIDCGKYLDINTH